MLGFLSTFIPRAIVQGIPLIFGCTGEILTEKILHAHRFTHPIFVDKGKHVYHISWSSFVYLLEGIIRKERDEYFDEENGEEITGEELSNIV